MALRFDFSPTSQRFTKYIEPLSRKNNAHGPYGHPSFLPLFILPKPLSQKNNAHGPYGHPSFLPLFIQPELLSPIEHDGSYIYVGTCGLWYFEMPILSTMAPIYIL